ncbi:MAG: methylmalonic aciduria and homocystinuria type D protein [Thermosynechococcaceae cyanobacterium]
MIGVQYSIHKPSAFINLHWADLLPDWPGPVASVLVILQPCSVALNHITPESEQQKQRLRRRALYLSRQLIAALEQADYWAEGFDPRSGLPGRSRPGLMTLDDVAVVQAVLGYRLIASGDCRLIEHPTWGCRVFPCVVVSTAPPEILGAIADRFWTEAGQSSRLKALAPAFGDGKG